MESFDDICATINRLAATQAGAFSVDQATGLGGDRSLLRTGARRGHWQFRARGLLVATAAPPGWRQDLWLAHLAAGASSVFCQKTAARLHRARPYRWAMDLDLLLPFDSDARTPIGRIHRARRLPRHHVVMVEGLPVTSLAWTLLDLAGNPENRWTFRNEVLRWGHFQRIRKLVNDTMRDNGLTMSALMLILAALGRRGRPGTAIMREVVADLGPDYVPTDSELEDMFLEIVKANELEEPERQQQISGPYGWIARVDFLYRALKLAIEIDGPHHDTPLQKRIDRATTAALKAAGYHVLRIHWRELWNDPDAVIARVLEAIAEAAA